jgi:hypothetical protein
MAGTIRRAAAFTAVSLLAFVGRPAQADVAVVQQDATPVVSAPGVGGQVLTRVDTGFTFTVLGREGAWLKVASPRLQLGGELWVPAERVGDIVAAPDEAALSDEASSATSVPQFRMTTATTGGVAATSSGDASIEPRDSNGVSAAVTRSTSSDAGRSAIRTTGGTTAADVTSVSDSPVPAEGNPTPATGSVVGSPGNPNPAASGTPTPAPGNPNPAASGTPTPALGNPTPALGNPTPGVVGSTPRTDNSVVGLRNSRAAMQ